MDLLLGRPALGSSTDGASVPFLDDIHAHLDLLRATRGGGRLLDPALAIFAIVVGMMISVRASDVRVAQQLSGLVMLPIFGAASLPAFRVVEPTVSLYVGAAFAIGVVDVVGLRLLLGMLTGSGYRLATGAELTPAAPIAPGRIS